MVAPRALWSRLFELSPTVLVGRGEGREERGIPPPRVGLVLVVLVVLVLVLVLGLFLLLFLLFLLLLLLLLLLL